MKHSNNLLSNQLISGESFFDEVSQNVIALDETCVPLDRSVIWHVNYIFWKHFSLWEKTYGEHYEASLPSGVSESHKNEFIEKSAKKFLHLLLVLDQKNKLPKEIIVLEQGPGTGMYAKKFLDFFKRYDEENRTEFYQRLIYIIQDTSKEILHVAHETLREHQKHVKQYVVIPKLFAGHTLLARHSNVWDQFPARLIVIDKQNFSEILVQAVINKQFLASCDLSKEDLSSFTRSHILRKDIEPFITTYPQLWKPLIRNLKFKTKMVKLSQKDLNNLPHGDLLQHLAMIAIDTQEIVISNSVLDNLQELIDLIDWQHNGYAEIVDIIVPTMDGFKKDRRPRKYDGSIATVINGPLIKTFVQQRNKHIQFDKIRGINYTVTMRNNTMQTLLEAKDFITIGEIAAKRDESIGTVKQTADALFTLGIDVVGFSDQAFVKPEYLSQKEIVATEIFKQLPGNALMPIVKTRNKTWEEIQTLTNKLKEQGVGNLFIVTGDPGLEKEILHTSIDITKKLKNDFFIGGVAEPDITNIPKMKEKIAAGTQFFIMQATYDNKRFEDWVNQIKKEKLHQKSPIIAALVPIVSKRTLSVLQFINDMSVTHEVIKQFENLDNQTIRSKGIALAKQMVATYKQTEIFSGIYIYSKSHEVICEIMGFPYHKTYKTQDSL